MGRITRAKAAEMHIHEDAATDLTHIEAHQDREAVGVEGSDRAPLAEIQANSGSSIHEENHRTPLNRPTRSNNTSTKKGSQRLDNIAEDDDKANVAPSPLSASKHTIDDTIDAPSDNACIIDSEPLPAGSAASNAPTQDGPELGQSHLHLDDIKSNASPPEAVDLTQNQVNEELTQSEQPQPQFFERHAASLLILDEESEAFDRLHGGALETQTRKEQIETVASVPQAETDPFSIMPNMLQGSHHTPPTRFTVPTAYKDSPDSDSLADNMESITPEQTADPGYDQLEAAAVQAHTPPKSKRMSTGDDPITALDDIDDAVEKVTAEVPDVQTSPQKQRSKKAPIVRTTKASQARISLVHGPKDPQRRVSSWGQPPAQTATRRTVSNSSNQANDGTVAARKAVEIPHSKPRPVSISFPTPPPLLKSTKVPTTSTFQLPGEAVAAKLKAARDARLQKEADEQKKKAFKARPAPAMTKAPAVRQTSTSKARESLMNGPPSLSASVPKRVSSVTSARPATVQKPNATKPAASSTTRSASSRPSSVSTSTISVAKRPSSAMTSISKPRPMSTIIKQAPSFASRTAAPAVRPASSIGTVRSNGTTKGREVFNRAAHAKSSAELEKRGKEEAAKKARAEAAELGRQRSREWAEKQKLKRVSVKTESDKPKENVPPLDEIAIENA